MSIKKIIPCLDIKNGRVVKGQNFINLQDMGDPVAFAKEYDRQGADELVFLDISATTDGKKPIYQLITSTIDAVSLPITVGGGISTLLDIKNLLNAGAAKVAINSAAIKNPALVKECIDTFGTNSLIIACDIGSKDAVNYSVFINGGSLDTGLNMLEWVSQLANMGVRTLLLTSINKDGTRDGYDLDAIKQIKNICDIDVIASGGGWELSHFRDAFLVAGADAALAASVFHMGKYTVSDVKNYLKKYNINVG